IAEAVERVAAQIGRAAQARQLGERDVLEPAGDAFAMEMEREHARSAGEVEEVLEVDAVAVEVGAFIEAVSSACEHRRQRSRAPYRWWLERATGMAAVPAQLELAVAVGDAAEARQPAGVVALGDLLAV